MVRSTSGATPLKKCAPRAKPQCCLGRDHRFHRAAWGGCRNPRSKGAVSSAICQSRDVADQQAATPRSDPDTTSHDLAQNRIGGNAYLPTLVEPPDEIIDETRAHIRSDRFPHFPKRPRSYNRNTATSAKACNQGIDHLRLDRSRSHFAEHQAASDWLSLSSSSRRPRRESITSGVAAAAPISPSAERLRSVRPLQHRRGMRLGPQSLGGWSPWAPNQRVPKRPSFK